MTPGQQSLLFSPALHWCGYCIDDRRCKSGVGDGAGGDVEEPSEAGKQTVAWLDGKNQNMNQDNMLCQGHPSSISVEIPESTECCYGMMVGLPRGYIQASSGLKMSKSHLVRESKTRGIRTASCLVILSDLFILNIANHPSLERMTVQWLESESCPKLNSTPGVVTKVRSAEEWISPVPWSDIWDFLFSLLVLCIIAKPGT